uniref:Protein lethal(2) giant larvae n=1 Tax=Cacopsylla melanoneura TaxID=428564 RepID=A0A8D8ZVM3_9HEMI
MFKFIQNKRQQPTADRAKLQKELFAYRKTVQHGFPNKPTCIAWDPELQIMAIGTATGAIKVVGKPGVEFYAHHASCDHVISNIIFIPGEGRLVSLLDDNSLHLWEINDSSMEETKTHTLEGKLKKISSWCLESSKDNLLLGTEGGNIYQLNVGTFEVSNNIIYQDLVMQNVPDHYKLNPGPVEAIAEQPGSPHHIVIGYSKGLVVLWDRTTNTANQTYISSQQIESLCWDSEGTKFISSHNDDSFTYWDTSRPSHVTEPTTLYGPFPCKPIHKLLWRVSPHPPHEELLIFSGGMPRASYSDKFTVTVQETSSSKHVVFDFTSRVIDFFTIAATEDKKGVTTLVVLAEEELVVIDLTSPDWTPLALPYLVSLHASAVTFSSLVTDLTPALWKELHEAARTLSPPVDTEWPISGGILLDAAGEDEPDSTNKTSAGSTGRHDLLLTGHEDGSVRLWDAGGVTLFPLLGFKSSLLMRGDEDLDEDSEEGEKEGGEDEEEDEWPPFRKVGCFDPYSDDPRLAVKKISLCPVTGTLLVAGTAGHVIMAKLNTKAATDVNVKIATMNIVSDRDSFVWKGHAKLGVKHAVGGASGGKDQQGPGKAVLKSVGPGYQPSALLQLHPPAAVTALILHTEWGVAVAGTAHGMAVFDIVRHLPICVKCTLNPSDITSGDAPISRRKSFKKSLRESFRRLRKGRSVRHPEPASAAGNKKPTSPQERRIAAADSGIPGEATKPVERAVEARGPQEDSLGSMVRCLYLGASYIVSTQHLTPSLWAGTNQGTVYVFTLNIPSSSKRNSDKVICQLAKEIQLKHRAPVIGVSIIDASCRPLPDSKEVESGLAKPPDTTGPHKVIIGSEEQFKVFSLPNLKPLCKLKLTASEGARVRRMSLASFNSRSHSEWCLLCLTNLGDIIVLSIPELRRQVYAAVIRREDITGISSLCLSRHGEALYLHSSSEFQRVTVSASRVTLARCRLEVERGNEVNGRDEDEATLAGEQTAEASSADNKLNSVVSSSVSRSVSTVVKQNGVSSSTGEHDESGNTTIQSSMSHDSIGDITIDSVRDHMVNSSSVSEEFRTVTTEVKHQVETTIKHEREIKKTSTVTVSETLVQNNNVSTTSVESVASTTSGGSASSSSSSSSSGSSTSSSSNSASSLTPNPAAAGANVATVLSEEIRKAPLANSEDFNETLI